MEKRFYIDPSKCTGCKTCELACSFSHQHTNPVRPGDSRIRVYVRGPERFFPMVCLQCVFAACMKACPVNAISVDKSTGAVTVDYGKCISCRACVAACPFGNMTWEEQSGRVIKCDLCGGDPACAKYCPSGALEYKPVERTYNFPPEPLKVESVSR